MIIHTVFQALIQILNLCRGKRRGAVQDRVMAYGPIGGGYYYASSLKGLKEAVASFDDNPSSVIWLDSIS